MESPKRSMKMRKVMGFYLKFYIKNIIQVIYIYGFYISVLLLFMLSGAAENARNAELLMQASWGGGLLAVLLSAELFFAEEEANGALVSIRNWPISTELVVFSKLIAHFLAIILPFSVAILASLTVLEVVPDGQAMSIWGLLLAGLGNCAALTMLASAMTVGANKRFALVSLLILPWLLPIVITGSAASLADCDVDHLGHALLPSLLLFIVPLCVLASAALIRWRSC